MSELIAARRRIALFLMLFLLAVVLLTSQVRTPDRRQIGPLGTAILAVLLPVQGGMAKVADGLTQWWQLYTTIGQLRVENRALRRQVEGLTNERTALQEQALGAQRLQRLLQLRERTAYRAAVARVIGRDIGQWFSTVVVDRGTRDGIVKNAPVVGPDGVLGRVIEVTPTAARVLLLSDSRSAISVVVQRSRDAAVVEGRGGQQLTMKYLSRASDTERGDVVVTSGLGGVFPPGLVVGRVTQVIREPGALMLEAAVDPAASLDRLEEVLILLPPP